MVERVAQLTVDRAAPPVRQRPVTAVAVAPLVTLLEVPVVLAEQAATVQPAVKQVVVFPVQIRAVASRTLAHRNPAQTVDHCRLLVVP